MKKYLIVSLLLTMIVGLTACAQNNKPDEVELIHEENNDVNDVNEEESFDFSLMEPAVALQLQEMQAGEEIAVITTNKGDIKLRFFEEQAPKAVENFKTLASNGYYEGLIFHRVIEDFMIQTGDPTGTGSGGESIWGTPFEDEFSTSLNHIRGAVSMANAGADTNGSQFFIVQNSELMDDLKSQMQTAIDEFDNPMLIGEEEVNFGLFISKEILEYYLQNGGTPHLDGSHTVFGQVFEGMDVVDTIATAEAENDRPVEDIIIEKIEILNY